jgi:hypothetical protein
VAYWGGSFKVGRYGQRRRWAFIDSLLEAI